MALSKLTKVQTLGIGSNIEVVGVITTGQFKSGTSNLHASGVELTNLNVSGIATIGGNLSIGGTLTYQDVTNIDSVGVITARSNIDCNGDLDVDGHTNLDNVSVAGVSTFSAGINVPDNQRINVGNGNDLYLKHDGTNSELHNNAGSLTIDSGIHLNITNVHGEDMAKFLANGAVELYHDDNLKFATSANGINVSGITTSNVGFMFGTDGEHYLYKSAANTATLRITSDGPYAEFKDVSGDVQMGSASGTLRLSSGGTERIRIGINASNSPVFSLGTGHYSGGADGNNHNQGDRASVKVGAYLHLESALGAGHNSRAGLGYNCYFSSLENFNCGTKSPSGGDNRPAAYGMAYGNHYFYSDASNTAHSAQASLTMTKNMVIHRQGYVTKPNMPIASLSDSGATDVSNAVLTSSNFYNHTWVNQGSHFNASNGRFTCPVAGVYRIYFRATTDQTQHTNVRLRRNGATINEAYANGDTGTTHSDSSEAVVNCSANDYLEIQASRLKASGGTQHKQVTFQLLH